jgi:Fic family protein
VSGLFRTPALDEQERGVLSRINDLKRAVGYATTGVPQRWYGMLRRILFARHIQASNSIEGYNVTDDDALAAAEGQEPEDATREAWSAVSGYRSAMTYVLQLSDDPHFRYTAELLRGLHYIMLSYDLAKNPGKWRPGPIYVRDESRKIVVYEGPDAGLVPDLIDVLVHELEETPSDTPPIVQAAMAHLNLVMVHPYSDGNGRMARCLQTLVLARKGDLRPEFCSIEEYLGRNTRDYYDVLAEVGQGSWHPNNDARPWLRFCLRAHFIQVTRVLRRSREMHRLWDALEVELQGKELPERVAVALSDAALGYRVRNSTYRAAAVVSDQQASRDLALLVREGFLVAHGEKRGRSYVAAAALKEIRERTREKHTDEDPFTSATGPYIPGFEPAGTTT